MADERSAARQAPHGATWCAAHDRLDGCRAEPPAAPGPCPARSPESHQPCTLRDLPELHTAGHESDLGTGEWVSWATADADRERWAPVTSQPAARRQRPQKLGVDDRDAAVAAKKAPPTVLPAAAPAVRERAGRDAYGRAGCDEAT